MQKEKKKSANNTCYLKTTAKEITYLKAYLKMSRFGWFFCQVASDFCWFQGFFVCMVLRRWEEILQSKEITSFLLYSLNVCFAKSAIQALKSHSKMYRWDGYYHTLLTLPNPDYKCHLPVVYSMPSLYTLGLFFILRILSFKLVISLRWIRHSQKWNQQSKRRLLWVTKSCDLNILICLRCLVLWKIIFCLP